MRKLGDSILEDFEGIIADLWYITKNQVLETEGIKNNWGISQKIRGVELICESYIRELK